MKDFGHRSQYPVFSFYVSMSKGYGSLFTYRIGSDGEMTHITPGRILRQNRWKQSKEKARASNAKWRAGNREHINQYRAEYRRRNPEKCREWVRATEKKKLYGMTLAEYDTFFIQHGGVCEVCGGMERLGVDHRHKDGFIRGILCGPCNSGLGFLQERLDLLDAMKAYLKKYGQT